MILTRNQLKDAFVAYANEQSPREKSAMFEDMMPTINELAQLIFIDIRLSDVELQKEILQRVYIKLFRFMTKEKVKDIKNFSGYVRVTVKNEANMGFRGDGRYWKYKNNQGDYTNATNELWHNTYVKKEEELPQSEHIIEKVNTRNHDYLDLYNPSVQVILTGMMLYQYWLTH